MISHLLKSLAVALSRFSTSSATGFNGKSLIFRKSPFPSSSVSQSS
ncbi:MAG: hypothetical protein IJN05_09770 [Ruminococcus sp.]|nr:hypothetical protein [Ruminococcus sp.]